MQVALIIPAAGASRRYSELGGLRSKLDEDLGGRPVLQRTIELFVKHESVGPLIHAIIVAGPHDDDEFAEFKTRHADRLSLLSAKIVRGGKTHRYETVKAALAHVPDDCTHVAVHDAARPCTPPEVLDRVFDMARDHSAVIPAIEVADTIKRVRDTGQSAAKGDAIDAILGVDPNRKGTLRVVEETIPRERLFAVQTPQVFTRELITKAYAQADLASTDDSQLIERLREPVAIAPGDPRNIKITTPNDLTLARAILGVKAPEGRPTHKRF